MKKLFFFAAGIVLPMLFCLAQPPNTKQLKIGDTVPDIQFANVINSPSSTIRLSLVNKKLIILDFWASWCGNCISLFPHMDSLQKKFGDRLQIILFNTKSRESHDDEQKIKKIISRVESKTGQTIGLPVIYDCETLDNYFPSKYVPHEVWLNGDRKVIGITSWIEVTEQNIASILNDQQVQLHTKEDVLDYDKNKPLFVNSNGGNGDDFSGSSILTGYKEGLFGTMVRSSGQGDGKIIGLSLLNVSLPVILQTAYAGTGKLDYSGNRTIIDVRDKEQFKRHEDSSFYQYAWCYDISILPTSMEQLRKYMQQDIERYFHITVKVEQRKRTCYILKTPANIPVSKKGEEDIEYGEGSIHKYLHHYKLSEVVKFFDLRLQYPLINETNLLYDEPVDVELPYDLKDQEALLQSLKKAGFRITKELRNIDVVVISDR